MEMAAVEPQSSPQFGTPTIPHSSEDSYKPLLQESIHHLLLQLRAGASDFSQFHLIFSRLVQTIPSPPVEIIWFYGAVNFHSHKAVIGHHDPKVRLSALKDLFHSLVACSDSCTALKRVAILAPLVSELYNLALGLKVDKNSSLVGDIACFLERIVSFISICCCNSVSPHDDSPALSGCFLDLARVWTFGHTDCFKVFFPAVSDEVRFRLTEGCGVGYLAGVVMFECFLLRLCLNLGSHAAEGKELVEAVKILATDMVTGFRSCYFFDILMESLLEPAISATYLLSSDAEILLQKVLFDAIIIVDYPLSHRESEMHTCNNHLKGLALSWLFVAENALSFTREHFNKSQADAYAGAFFKSVSHSWLMGWLINKLKIEDIVIQQISSSPAALFDWISGLHNQASDADISKLLEKMARCRSRWNSKLPVLQQGGQNKECGKDLYTNDYTVADMNASTPGFNFCIDRGRKRKGVSDGEMGLQLKTLKYQFRDDSFNRPSPLHSGNGWGRKNEMASPAHDDDMEITVQ